MSRALHARKLAASMAVAMLAVGLAGIVDVGAQPVPYPETPVGGWTVNGRVLATEIIGDTVYVGGTFTSVSGPGGTVSRQNLAAFDSLTGALRTGFVANANQAVRGLETDGTTLFVGGSFSSIGGVSRQRVAALNRTTGSVTGFKANANGYVNALKVTGNRLYVGGTFSSLAGHGISRVGAVDKASGAAITSFAPSPNGTVHGVETTPDGSQVFVTGEFTSIAGTDRRYIAGLTPSGSSTGPSYASVVKYAVLQSAYDPQTGLLFAAVAGWGNQIAALDTRTGKRPWRQYAEGDVQAVAVDGNNVYFGFHEGFNGDTSVKMLAADTRTGALVAGWRFNASSYMGVMSITVDGSTLVAGGELGWVKNKNAGGMAILPRPGQQPPPTTAQPTTTAPPTTAPPTTAPPTTAPPPAGGALVPPGADWRYQMGDAPANWADPAFNDGSWAHGPAELGYGDGDEATVIGPMANTGYFRRSFSLAAVPTKSLTVAVLADDGALVRLNGIEVLRDNLPAGSIGPSTLSPEYKWGDAETKWVTITVPPTALRVGTNTLAIEVHQANGSIDLSFNASLTAHEADPAPPTTAPPTTAPPTTAPPPAGGALVPPGADWRYRMGDAPANWADPAFNDGPWAHGPAELGYGDGDEATVIGPMAYTGYFRRSFSLAAVPTKSLTVAVLADDGALVRLNGIEVLRDNLPAGPVTALTEATAYKNGGAETRWVSLTISPSALRVGTNTLAVEVHQAGKSSDLSFNASLTPLP